jgi:Dolichyl-phosphate-mannose-protein mannosyltransferase
MPPVARIETRAELAEAPFHSHVRKGLPLLFILIYVAQCVWFIRTQSFTYDEPVHIAEGLNAWRYGRFEQYNDHPPLARLLCTLPLLNSRWQVDVQQEPESFSIPRITPDPLAMAWRARSMIVLLGILLAWSLWGAARQFFSPGAATFALAFFAFSPGLIAHFSLATTDGAATLLIFVAAWQLIVWKRNPSWQRTLLFGLLLGLMLLAKYSTLPVFPLALFWMLVLVSGRFRLNPKEWNWAKTATALALALLVVWAGYFFHVSKLSVHNGTLTATFPNWQEPIQKLHVGMNYTIYVPAGEYIEGLRELVRHNAHGQPAYFMGQVSRAGGWKLYYPVAILLKWPSVVLILALAGLVLAAARRLHLPADLWIMLSFPGLYTALAVFARFNIGVRHVLPLYPFALLLAAAVWERARGKRAVLVLLVLLAAVNVADALRYAPDYLAYFNVLVPERQSYRFLTDSNLDWGQGLLAVRKYEQSHPMEQIRLAYFGSVDPAIYGIKAQPLAENERVTGTVIISATDLSGQYLRDPAGYRWLLAYRPERMLNHSMFVFKINGP